jgi:hypothetical protein
LIPGPTVIRAPTLRVGRLGSVLRRGADAIGVGGALSRLRAGEAGFWSTSFMLVFPCGSDAAESGAPDVPVCRRFKNTVSQLAVGALCHFAIRRRRRHCNIPTVVPQWSDVVAWR